MDANSLKVNVLNDEAQAAATADSSEAIASGASPAPGTLTLSPANTMADPAFANQSSAFDFQFWPDEWRDDAPSSVYNFSATYTVKTTPGAHSVGHATELLLMGLLDCCYADTQFVVGLRRLHRRQYRTCHSDLEAPAHQPA